MHMWERIPLLPQAERTPTDGKNTQSWGRTPTHIGEGQTQMGRTPTGRKYTHRHRNTLTDGEVHQRWKEHPEMGKDSHRWQAIQRWDIVANCIQFS